MKTYIRNNIKGYYIDFEEEIDAEYWEGKIGETYQDFLDGKWVLLSDEQVKFHEDNPQATIKEVLDMQLSAIYEPSQEELLEIAKQDKIHELSIYDNGPEVNEFSINEVLKTWFTPEERSNYKNSIDSAKLLNIESLQLLVDGNVLTIPTEQAATLLAMIQLYADACYMVTQSHKAAISKLDSIEDVENYDFTINYPQKLNFNL